MPSGEMTAELVTITGHGGTRAGLGLRSAKDELRGPSFPREGPLSNPVFC